MVFPLVQSPLGGIVGATTASFFKLTPVGIPFEPLLDLVPGLTPLRITFDMIDGESESIDFDVTEHAVQSFLDITSNIHERLNSISITGTLGAVGPMLPVPQPPAPAGLTRLDLLRIENLKSLAKKKQPVMCVTPRVGFPFAAFVNITPQWTPALGESSTVTVQLKEVRIVSPIAGPLVEDFAAQTPANNAASGGGQSATSDVAGDATASEVDGLPPAFSGGITAP